MRRSSEPSATYASPSARALAAQGPCSSSSKVSRPSLTHSPVSRSHLMRTRVADIAAAIMASKKDGVCRARSARSSRRSPSGQSLIVIQPDVTDTTFAVCLDVLLYAQHVEHRDERLDLHAQREGEFLNADPSVPRGELGHNLVAEFGLCDMPTWEGYGSPHFEGGEARANFSRTC